MNVDSKQNSMPKFQTSSHPFRCTQGSILGPLLSVLYTFDIQGIYIMHIRGWHCNNCNAWRLFDSFT